MLKGLRRKSVLARPEQPPGVEHQPWLIAMVELGAINTLIPGVAGSIPCGYIEFSRFPAYPISIKMYKKIHNFAI